MTMQTSRCFYLFLLLMPIFLIGCGRGHVGISGRVTYTDDGSPLETGSVVFENGSFQSRGEIGADGKYTLGSFSTKDGLPKGNYRVYLNRATVVQGEIRPGIPNTVHLVAKKYTSPETSGLECVVDGSSKRFDIQVERFKKTVAGK